MTTPLTITSAPAANVPFIPNTITFSPIPITWGVSPALTVIEHVSVLTLVSAPSLSYNWDVVNIQITSASVSPSGSSADSSSNSSPTTTSITNGNQSSNGNSSSIVTTTIINTAIPGSSNEGLSVGKAVGIGIGSAIAAAPVLALVAAACFWRRRNLRRPRHASHTGEFLMGPTTKASSSSSSAYLQDKLPQPITRKDIEKEASRLEGAIRNYVENFTDCQASSKRHYDGSKLNTSDLSEYSQYRVQWATLLQENSKRYNALRMFIARVLAFRTSATGEPSSTLLPAEMLQMYQQIIAGREKDEHMQHVWRTLTADLLSTTYSTSTIPLRASDPRSGALEDTVAVIMKALEPFRLKQQGSETREHEILIELVAKAALLGLRLFMQTALTEFFWSDTSTKGHTSQVSQHMEVFPGIRQWTGTKGSRPDIIRETITQ